MEGIGDAREHVNELVNDLADGSFIALLVAFTDKSKRQRIPFRVIKCIYINAVYDQRTSGDQARRLFGARTSCQLIASQWMDLWGALMGQH